MDETRERASRAQAVLYELALLALAALLFALSFPSFLSRWGWFPLAYVALVPVFLVIHRAGWLGIGAVRRPVRLPQLRPAQLLAGRLPSPDPGHRAPDLRLLPRW